MRSACDVLADDKSTNRYKSCGRGQADLWKRIKEIIETRNRRARRLGFRTAKQLTM